MMQVFSYTSLSIILLFMLLQQDYVLAELQEYATSCPTPPDANSVMETVEYLRACNHIFERGILGKGVFIRSADNPILKGMETGYKYFTLWLNRKLQCGMSIVVTGKPIPIFYTGYTITMTSKRLFLAWQTWDLLRIMYYGFTGFCQ